MSSSIYSTVPVYSGTQQIRLIKASRSANGQIDCELHVFGLGDHNCPRYTAASYLWGPSYPQSQILVNNYPHSVNSNLYSVLYMWTSYPDAATNKSLELSHRAPTFTYLFFQLPQTPWHRPTSWLWVDALCINQANNAERSHQVSIMSSIYAKAECVIAWLGPSQLSQNLVSRLRTAIPGSTGIIYADTPRVETLLSKLRWSEGVYMDESAVQRLESMKAPHNQELNNLLNHAYWTRAWIIQEVSLARYLVFTDGQNFHPWTQLQAATALTHGTENTAGYRLLIEKSDIQSRPLPLNEQLIRWRQQNCQDWHDKVYAFLGISECQRMPTPDYNCSKEQLFSSVMASIDWQFTVDVDTTSIALARSYNQPQNVDVPADLMRPMGGARSPMEFCRFLARFTASLGLQPDQPLVRQAFMQGYHQANKHYHSHWGTIGPTSWTGYTSYESLIADKRNMPNAEAADDCWWLFLQFCNQISSPFGRSSQGPTSYYSSPQASMPQLYSGSYYY